MINPEYVEAFLQIAKKEIGYKSGGLELPEILQEFKKISEKENISISFDYGVNEVRDGGGICTCGGFYVTRNDINKRIFLEDDLIERTKKDSEDWGAAILWFENSLKNK